jgi:hypothetical protein
MAFWSVRKRRERKGNVRKYNDNFEQVQYAHRWLRQQQQNKGRVGAGTEKHQTEIDRVESNETRNRPS